MGYEAIGNGGWSACYRIQGGMAACNPFGTPTASGVVKWSSGSPITNVAHISTYSDSSVLVVTDDGKAYKGGYTSVSETPVIASEAISSTGGKNPLCILTGTAARKDIRCDNAGTLTRPALPADFNAVQITAAYGFVCALNTKGEVWCWEKGGNTGGGLQSVISATPSKFPFDKPMVFISVGQNSVCGVQQSGGLKCKFSYYDSLYLPAIAANNLAETPDGFLPNVKYFQAAYGKGVAINKDGSAIYFPGNKTITGLGKAVSAGGDRAALSVVNDVGDVFVVDGGIAVQANKTYRAEAPVCALK